MGAVQVGGAGIPIAALEDDLAVLGDEQVQGVGQIRIGTDGGVSGQETVDVQRIFLQGSDVNRVPVHFAS